MSNVEKMSLNELIKQKDEECEFLQDKLEKIEKENKIMTDKIIRVAKENGPNESLYLENR